jgi:tetratricopeptide (TPR) repeat protein
MNKFSPEDRQYLDAAEGWLGLGDHVSANEELEQITPELRADPKVLLVRLQIYWSKKNWEGCVEIAGTIVKLCPEITDGWIGRSYALHELKRTQEAFDLLSLVKDKFPENHTITYNLACYCSQLDRLEEAQEWLKKAMAIDEKAVKVMAIDDPDLKPLWDSMSGTMWKR